MAKNDIGIDLGTTSIIVSVEGEGVVLNQPSIVAVDTRQNKVLAVGDDALAMVGRTPNYISAIRPLKDGVISDHMLTRELICRFVKQVYNSHMVKPRVAVCSLGFNNCHDRRILFESVGEVTNNCTGQ